MKKANTHLNSILFNTVLIMVATPAILQLAYVSIPLLMPSAAVSAIAQVSFRTYCRFTVGQLIFDGMLARTPVFQYVQPQRRSIVNARPFFKYNIFIWALVVWAIMNFIVLIARPKESRAFSLQVLREWRAKKKAAEGEQASKKEPGAAAGDEESGLMGRVDGLERGMEKTAGKFEKGMNVIGKMAF